MEAPFYGSRQMKKHLWHQGIKIGRDRVRRLMRKMGLGDLPEAQNESAASRTKIYPYMLRGLRISRQNQVWYTDITYVPMKRGSCIWSQLWTVTVVPCLLGVCRTRWMHIFVWQLWKRLLIVTECRKSLIGIKVRSLPVWNVFKHSRMAVWLSPWTVKTAGWIVMIERLWWSVKWECFYLREVEIGIQPIKILRDLFQFCSEQHPHTAFDGRRPMEV